MGEKNRSQNQCRRLLATVSMLLLYMISFAQDNDDKAKDSAQRGTIRYNPEKGFELKTGDNRFRCRYIVACSFDLPLRKIRTR